MSTEQKRKRDSSGAVEDGEERAAKVAKNEEKIKIAVFALQGAVREHVEKVREVGAEPVEFRTVAELKASGAAGLILPGGESTCMGIVGTGYKVPGSSSSSEGEEKAETIVDALRSWVRSGKPTYGTCAGMILLAEKALGARAHQPLLGGLDVTVHRNFFGSQLRSFETGIAPPPRDDAAARAVGDDGDNSDFNGVFIRAPAIVRAGKGVQVLASLEVEAAAPHPERDAKSAPEAVASSDAAAAAASSGESKGESGKGKGKAEVDADYNNLEEIIVAVRSNSILATAFHPELTDDARWHKYFLGMVKGE